MYQRHAFNEEDEKSQLTFEGSENREKEIQKIVDHHARYTQVHQPLGKE